MRSKVTWILTLFFSLIVQVGFAQQKKVSGVVKTQDGDPIPGATVLLVGTNEGTDTDLEGTYTLNASKGDKIKVAYLGYKSVTLTVSDSNVLNVTLQEEEIDVLDEIVIDQYRTMSKQESTVAQTTITSKTIEGRPNANVIQTLQGQVPGLNIMTGSGQPGSDDIDIVLRGVGSINGSTKPLFIVDGAAMADDRFRSINPNDIETITVLKDAGATSIYGNRGANGVIVITTKRGSFNQDLSVKYSGLTGVQFLQDNNYNLMNSRELMTFENKVGVGSWTPEDMNNAVNTDWQNIFFAPAIQQNHTISFSAGSKNLSSNTSLGYADYEGILKTTGLKRFNLRSNLNGKNDSGRLNYSTSLGMNYSKNKMLNGTGTNLIYHNYFLGAFRALPYVDPNRYNWGRDYDSTRTAEAELGDAGVTPIVLLNRMLYTGYGQNELKMNLNGAISYKLSDDITIGNQAGVDYQSISQTAWYSPLGYSQRRSIEGQTHPDGKPVLYTGSYAETLEERFVFNNTASLKYSKTFSDVHTVNVGLYTEYIKAHLNSTSISKRGFDPLFFAPGTGSGWIADNPGDDIYAVTGGKNKFNSGLFSYFGTVGYDYDKRFGLDATIRRDASFRFTKDNQWGTFWSVAGRWNISNEKFMENSIFTDLKLRGSYGVSGNQDITNAGYFGGANLFSTRYGIGVGYLGESSVFITQIPNESLKWETTTQGNVGLDFGLFNNRLRGTFDVYQKNTDDLFLSRRLSAINGQTQINANYGSMENQGVELMLQGDIIRTENTRITLSANGSYNKNTVTEIPETTGFALNLDQLTGYKVGQPFAEFYLYKFAGIDAASGDALYYKQGGGTTKNPTDDDRFWTGKTMWPKYQGSFGIDVEHKGFFLTANFTYAKDVYRYDNDYYWYTTPGFAGVFNMSNDINGAWSSTNKTNASFPKLNSQTQALLSDSDFYVKDASYIRMRFISVGYNFKKSDLDFLNLSGLRVFAQGENLLTWTKWKGWDAESSRQLDFGQYPTPRSVSFGVEVQF